MLAILRDALNAISELDTDLSPAYFEDIDWCFRPRSAGIVVRDEPTSRLVHHDRGCGRGAAQVMAYECARVGFML